MAKKDHGKRKDGEKHLGGKSDEELRRLAQAKGPDRGRAARALQSRGKSVAA